MFNSASLLCPHPRLSEGRDAWAAGMQGSCTHSLCAESSGCRALLAFVVPSGSVPGAHATAPSGTPGAAAPRPSSGQVRRLWPGAPHTEQTLLALLAAAELRLRRTACVRPSSFMLSGACGACPYTPVLLTSSTPPVYSAQERKNLIPASAHRLRPAPGGLSAAPRRRAASPAAPRRPAPSPRAAESNASKMTRGLSARDCWHTGQLSTACAVVAGAVNPSG